MESSELKLNQETPMYAGFIDFWMPMINNQDTDKISCYMRERCWRGTQETLYMLKKKGITKFVNFQGHEQKSYRHRKNTGTPDFNYEKKIG